MEVVDRLSATGPLVIVYAVTDQSREEFIRQGSGRSKIVQNAPEADLEGIL